MCHALFLLPFEEGKGETCTNLTSQTLRLMSTHHSAPVQRCYCAINVPLLWCRRLPVASAQAKLVKTDHASVCPDTAYVVFLGAHCSRLVCNSQVRSETSPQWSVPGYPRASGRSLAQVLRRRDLSFASCFSMWDLRLLGLSLLPPQHEMLGLHCINHRCHWRLRRYLLFCPGSFHRE